MEQSTFPGAGGPFDGQHFSGTDGKIDPFQDFHDLPAAAQNVIFFEVLDLDQRTIAGPGRGIQTMPSFAGLFWKIPSALSLFSRRACRKSSRIRAIWG
jgi:hypothetical protein